MHSWQPPLGRVAGVLLDGEHGVGFRGVHKRHDRDGGPLGVIVAFHAGRRGTRVEVVSARHKIVTRVRLGPLTRASLGVAWFMQGLVWGDYFSVFIVYSSTEQPSYPTPYNVFACAFLG